MEAETFDYDGEPLRAAISLCAAAFEPSHSADALIARADARLYRAKEEGMNRTVWEGG